MSGFHYTIYSDIIAIFITYIFNEVIIIFKCIKVAESGFNSAGIKSFIFSVNICVTRETLEAKCQCDGVREKMGIFKKNPKGHLHTVVRSDVHRSYLYSIYTINALFLRYL